MDEVEAILEAIAAALDKGGEHDYAALVRDALAGSEETLADFDQTRCGEEPVQLPIHPSLVRAEVHSARN